MNHLEGNFSVAYNIPDEGISDRIRQSVNDEDWRWLTAQVQRVAADPQSQLLARIFTTIPRNITSLDKALYVSMDAADIIGRHQLPLVIKGWPLVKLIRVWVLMHIPPLDQAAYVSLMEKLFMYGEMEELVALYAALPIYYYPEAWCQRCTEGIRSNMGPVRQAIITHNHYPQRFLGEDAWNQMILKAFFTGEDVSDVIGLKKRNNSQLAHALVDYAYELHAAKRNINPMLWILVSPYLDARAIMLMKQVFGEQEHPLTRKAIAFALDRSNFDLAPGFLKEVNGLKGLLDATDTPWKDWCGGAD